MVRRNKTKSIKNLLNGDDYSNLFNWFYTFITSAVKKYTLEILYIPKISRPNDFETG